MIPGSESAKEPPPQPFPRWFTTVATLLTLVGVLRAEVEATIVLVVRTPREIYIGVESKIATHDDGVARPPICKLYELDPRSMFGISGWMRARDGYYDIIIGTRRMVTDGHGLPRIERAIAKTLARYLRQFPQYRHLIGPKHAQVTGVAFVGIDPTGTPWVRMRDFVRAPGDRNQRIEIKRSACPPDCGRDYYYVTGLGAPFEDIERRLIADPSLLSLAERQPGGIPAAIRRWIEGAISAHPEICGPPISVARINATGIKWYDRSNECARQ